MITIGAQLFTLREKATTLGELSEALARVADMGYTAVQISGVCPYEPEWMAEQLKKNGLVAPVTHFAADQIRDNTEKVVKDHAVYGCNRIGLGVCPGWMSDATFDGFVKDYLPASETMKALGAKLQYHNHWHEFMPSADGELFLDKLCRVFPADQLAFILDTYWAQYSGCDVAARIEKLAGRVDCVHLKDMRPLDDKPAMMPIGEGNMNWERILESCEKAGVKFALVEQDNCNGEDPFDCLKRSYNYLKKIYR